MFTNMHSQNHLSNSTSNDLIGDVEVSEFTDEMKYEVQERLNNNIGNDKKILQTNLNGDLNEYDSINLEGNINSLLRLANNNKDKFDFHSEITINGNTGINLSYKLLFLIGTNNNTVLNFFGVEENNREKFLDILEKVKKSVEYHSIKEGKLNEYRNGLDALPLMEKFKEFKDTSINEINSINNSRNHDTFGYLKKIAEASSYNIKNLVEIVQALNNNKNSSHFSKLNNFKDTILKQYKNNDNLTEKTRVVFLLEQEIQKEENIHIKEKLKIIRYSILPRNIGEIKKENSFNDNVYNELERINSIGSSIERVYNTLADELKEISKALGLENYIKDNSGKNERDKNYFVEENVKKFQNLNISIFDDYFQESIIAPFMLVLDKNKKKVNYDDYKLIKDYIETELLNKKIKESKKEGAGKYEYTHYSDTKIKAERNILINNFGKENNMTDLLKNLIPSTNRYYKKPLIETVAELGNLEGENVDRENLKKILGFIYSEEFGNKWSNDHQLHDSIVKYEEKIKDEKISKKSKEILNLFLRKAYKEFEIEKDNKNYIYSNVLYKKATLGIKKIQAHNSKFTKLGKILDNLGTYEITDFMVLTGDEDEDEDESTIYKKYIESKVNEKRATLRWKKQEEEVGLFIGDVENGKYEINKLILENNDVNLKTQIIPYYSMLKTLKSELKAEEGNEELISYIDDLINYFDYLFQNEENKKLESDSFNKALLKAQQGNREKEFVESLSFISKVGDFFQQEKENDITIFLKQYYKDLGKEEELKRIIESYKNNEKPEESINFISSITREESSRFVRFNNISELLKSAEENPEKSITDIAYWLKEISISEKYCESKDREYINHLKGIEKYLLYFYKEKNLEDKLKEEIENINISEEFNKNYLWSNDILKSLLKGENLEDFYSIAHLKKLLEGEEVSSNKELDNSDIENKEIFLNYYNSLIDRKGLKNETKIFYNKIENILQLSEQLKDIFTFTEIVYQKDTSKNIFEIQNMEDFYSLIVIISIIDDTLKKDLEIDDKEKLLELRKEIMSIILDKTELGTNEEKNEYFIENDSTVKDLKNILSINIDKIGLSDEKYYLGGEERTLKDFILSGTEKGDNPIYKYLIMEVKTGREGGYSYTENNFYGQLKYMFKELGKDETLSDNDREKVSKLENKTIKALAFAKNINESRISLDIKRVIDADLPELDDDIKNVLNQSIIGQEIKNGMFKIPHYFETLYFGLNKAYNNIQDEELKNSINIVISTIKEKILYYKKNKINPTKGDTIDENFENYINITTNN